MSMYGGKRRTRRRKVGGRKRKRLSLAMRKRLAMMRMMKKLRAIGKRRGMHGRGLWDWVKEQGKNLLRFGIDKGVPALANLAKNAILRRIGLGRRRKRRVGKGQFVSAVIRRKYTGKGRRRRVSGKRRPASSLFAVKQGPHTVYGGMRRRRGMGMGSLMSGSSRKRPSMFA